MPGKTKAQIRQDKLAAIKDLTIGDVLKFFGDRATERDKQIADLVETGDEDFEVDESIVSEGDDNGAYVLGWRWASFYGTDFDKDVENEDEEEAEPA